MELKSGRLMALAAAAGQAGEWAAVPPELEKMAQRKLEAAHQERRDAFVNMRSQHPLAKWGRDKSKRKRKAKIAAASRRRNRNGKR